MATARSRHLWLAAICAVTAFIVAAAASALGARPAGADSASESGPIVTFDGGAVRGVAVLAATPSAASPTRLPRLVNCGGGRRSLRLHGRVFATRPSSRRAARSNAEPVRAAGAPVRGLPVPECLHADVAPRRRAASAGVDPRRRPHPGCRPQLRRHPSSRRSGIVVVTINYRLGALGFLAHPALASRPGGPAGNYGLMDQQAALRWVERNIEQFGGDPDNVTIAGQSAGGLSVLAHLVSRGSRGLFQRAIVQSGAFALKPGAARRRQGVRPDVRDERGLPRPELRSACAPCRSQPSLTTSRAPRSRASSTARSSRSRSGRRWPPGGSPACRSSTASTTMRSSSSSPASAWP